MSAKVAFFSKAPWRIAVLTAAGLATTSPATEAATSIFWQDFEDDTPAITSPQRAIPQRRAKSKHHRTPKASLSPKEATRPQGLLIIAISIEKQSLKVYDANGIYAETPISTGMRGHSTPMGVFSVIQKHKWHRSNIYSSAPMPYMQRITWSGVAMHAGVLPGYPASHGCIRMPMAFAVKMWGWSRMGARVVITPGEVTPANFSHPLLATRKVAIPAIATVQPRAANQSTAKSDKALAVDKFAAPSSAQTTLEASPDQIRTANVSGVLPTPAFDSIRIADAAQTPGEIATAAAATSRDDSSGLPNLEKEQARAPDPEATTVPKSDTPIATDTKRTGQIAIFISRKDGRLYARRNFAPLFDLPITIAASERPLGTHVFTTDADKNDANVFRWSVISLPVRSRSTERRDIDDRSARRRRIAGAIEVKTAPMPDSAFEALDRLAIPEHARALIADALSTGGSIIVSDQGIAGGETGEGTDFIVSLH